MGEEYLNERQRRAVAYILDDEGLTGDLTDEQARPLLDWASTQAAQAAGDPARSDDAVDAVVRAIRRAVLRVAITAPHEYNPERLVSLARQTLEKSTRWLGDPS